MKITIDDAGIDALTTVLATKIAKLIGSKKPGKPAADDAADDETGDEGDGDNSGGDDDFGDGAGEGDGDDGEVTATREDVREALKAVSKKFGSNGQSVAMEILKKAGGAAALSKLKEPKFQAVIDAAAKRVKAGK